MSVLKRKFLTAAILVTSVVGFGAAANAGHLAMYGAYGDGSGADRGDVILLNPSDTSQATTVGNPTTSGGITGIDFDGQGNLWGSTLEGLGNASGLIQIDARTGAPIASVGTIHTDASNVFGSGISIGDLAFDRTTNRLFGIESQDKDGVSGGNIYTIDLGTGLATFVGATIWGTTAGIAFDDLGTLYALGWDPNVGDYGTNMLFTLDSTDASELARVTVSRNDFIFSGLGINPLTGDIYATEDDYFASGTGTGNVYLVDSLTGEMTFVGKPPGVVSDVAFRVPEPSGLAIFALAVVGLGVARRRRIG